MSFTEVEWGMYIFQWFPLAGMLETCPALGRKKLSDSAHTQTPRLLASEAGKTEIFLTEIIQPPSDIFTIF